MESIKIGNMNIKNSRKNRSKNNSAKILSDFIIKEQFDFFATQELTYYFVKKLKKHLINNYKVLGKFRYSNKVFKTLVPFNEANAIITNKEVVSKLTLNMPFFPKLKGEFKLNKLFHIAKRIADITIVDEHNICFINTHLDYSFKSVQKKQLEYLFNLINKYSNHNIVLTGDFNMETSYPLFLEFINKLETLNIKRISVDEPTFGNKTIDHIFISSKWTVLEQGIIKNDQLDNLTDHHGIYAKVLIK